MLKPAFVTVPVSLPAAAPAPAALPTVVALREVEVAAHSAGADAAPADTHADPTTQWVHLVPAGATTGRDGRGPYVLDAQAVTAAFAQHGADLPVDYEHQSLAAMGKSGPVPAAGWIVAVQARADGLWAQVSWTAQASQLLKDRAYRYLSAVFDHLPDGRVIRLRGAGLVHSPNLPIQAAASQQAVAALTTPLSSTTPAATTAAQGQTMTIEELQAQVATLTQQLAEARATAAAPSPQASLQAGASLPPEGPVRPWGGPAAAQSAQAALAPATPALPDPTQWVPMGQYQATAAQLAAVQGSVAATAVQAAVTAAMSAGKVAPAQKDWATAYAAQDLAGFEAFVAASPVIVSAQAQAVAPQGTATAAHSAAMSDSDREVARLLGIAAADFALSKAAQAR